MVGTHPDFKLAIGHVMRTLRVAKALSQKDLAALGGYPPEAWVISKLETGRWAESRAREMATALAPHLGAEPQRILDDAQALLDRARGQVEAGGEVAGDSGVASLLELAARPRRRSRARQRTEGDVLEPLRMGIARIEVHLLAKLGEATGTLDTHGIRSLAQALDAMESVLERRETRSGSPSD